MRITYHPLWRQLRDSKLQQLIVTEQDHKLDIHLYDILPFALLNALKLKTQHNSNKLSFHPIVVS